MGLKSASKPRLEEVLYPEYSAGQYSHKDCTVAFYSRIRALITPSDVVLNVGAGRGANILTDPSLYRRRLQTFRGMVKTVIGLDVDPVVLENTYVDRAHVVTSDAQWPVPSESIDLIVCDHVIEHLEHPSFFASEVFRVLKPGGWFCARTPTKWGYIGLATRTVPNAFHAKVLRVMQPHRAAKDIFPTRYKVNTFRAIRSIFPQTQWRDCSYGYNGVPGYHGNVRILFRFIEAWCWLMPKKASAKIHIFLQKKR